MTVRVGRPWGNFVGNLALVEILKKNTKLKATNINIIESQKKKKHKLQNYLTCTDKQMNKEKYNTEQRKKKLFEEKSTAEIMNFKVGTN